MARLPIPGSDDGSWGDILNAYLLQSLAADGSIRTGAVGSPQLADNAVTSAKLAPSAVTASHLSTGSVTNSAITDGAIAQGKIANLSGDLAGKASTTHTHSIADTTSLQTTLDSKAASVHTHTASQISDASTAGRSLMTAADAATQRSALGLGSAATLTVGTTAGTVAAGDDNRITGAQSAATLDADVAVLVGDGGSSVASVLSSTFGTPGRLALTHGDHLAASMRLLRDALYRPFNLTVAGNSITLGQYAENVGSINDAILRNRGWVGQLRQLFASTYGNPGEGVVILGDARVTSSGTSNVTSVGISQNVGKRLDAAADYVEIATGEACTEVWIHGWWESDAKCPNSIYYTVDGGGDTEAVIGPLGTDKYWTYKITGLSDATHTIRVKGQNAEQIDLAGFQLVRQPTNGGGVRIHRLHASGGYISDTNGVFMLSTGTASSVLRNRILTLGTGMAHSADLLVLAFGANEVTPTGETAGWTPTKYEAELRSVVNYATTTHGCDVLLLTTGRRTTGLGTNGEYDQAIHEEIASDTARVAHLSIPHHWGDWTAANAAGFMYDTVHPNRTGHSSIAHLVHRALSTL